jgi:hypothetical protein
VLLSVKNKVGEMHALSKNFWEGRIVKLLKPILPAEITTKPNLLSLRFRFRGAPLCGIAVIVPQRDHPLWPDNLCDLRANAPLVVRRGVPDYKAEYARRRWKMFPSIDRVYVNERARQDLG